MARFAPLLASSALLTLLSAECALGQQLSQRIVGGSVPGVLQMRAGPSVGPGTFGVVFISFGPASIPLSLLDPTDPRSLGVGLELGGVSPFGISPGGGVWDAPPLAIPNLASFIDGALFFQSTFIPGPTYFLGPLSRVDVVRFGPAGQFRDRGNTMNLPRSFFPAIPLPNGKVLVPGGGSGALLAQFATSQVDVYDPLTDTFDAAGFMNSARSLHTATVMFDGRILLVGGVDQNNDPVATSEIYDPSTAVFTPGPTMSVARMGHTATLLFDGRVLITGGLADLNQTSTPIDPIYSSQATTEWYDPTSNTFVAGPNMRDERAAHGAIELSDGRVLLFGGAGFTRVLFVDLPSVERTTDIFNPITNQITAGPSMVTPRALASVSDLGAGRFLVAGGIDDLDLVSQGTPTNSAEIYNSTSNTWSSTGSMAVARGIHTSFALDGGRHLLIGGAGGSVLAPTSIGSTEIYNPTTGMFSAGPAMPTPLSAFGSYVNDQGQIHILGGSDAAGVVTSTFWYYR